MAAAGLTTLWQDMRYSFRGLRRTPGFALVTVLVLALGIGANASLFSVLNAVLLRPLPFPEPERLVIVQQAKQGELGGVSYPNLLDWRASSTSFERLAVYTGTRFTLSGQGEAERVSGVIASADLFPLLGTAPALGRTFWPEEDRLGGSRDGVRPVVLSHAFWRRQFPGVGPGDPSVLGRVLRLDDVPFTVVGVMPEGFVFPLQREPVDLWVSVAVDAEPSAYGGTIPTSRGYMRYDAAIARLKPGVSVEQAQAELSAVAAEVARTHTDWGAYTGVRVVPGLERLVGSVRPVLLLLFGAVACVLLIGCVNVANLLLARATVRKREVAVRLALGASRARVVQLLLTESLLLSCLGGALGLLLSVWCVDLLLGFAPADVPRLDEVRVDGVVLGFTLLLSLVTALGCGLAPALGGSGPGLREALKDAGRGATGGRSMLRLRGVLVVAQTALALVLLVGAALLMNSLVRLTHVDPGFASSGLLTVNLDLPVSRYPMRSAQVSQFYTTLVERLRGLPGVTAVSTAELLPLSGLNNGTSVEVEGAPASADSASRLRFVGQDYFRTLGIPRVAGRDFVASDDRSAPAVAVVNEAFVRRFLAGREPLGQRVKLGWGGGTPKEIVGVVRDVKHESLGTAPEPEVYVPHLQFPLNALTVILRTSRDPLALVPDVRAEVRALDAGVPLAGVRTVEAFIDSSLLPQRFVTLLLGVFAGVALVLTLLGLSSVMAYTVAQRTHEFGIRTALGAQASDVLWLVLRQGVRRTCVGVGLGVVGALVLTRLLEQWLYGVTPTDPWTFAAASLLLTTAALFACYVPARRATRVSPLVALRSE
ncbi:ABC transporter permease [Pyxidicoccus xibeiensis]|uniref:ABC transporter permease n=1 Tax=Pyxidicoccus xibeiensis TaxID=2906759 RepID=UPI0020A73CE7|nr:ABC transporter permease [Pyxidicoccus xibeiensis]MCP3142613.1 ABC transporter permease [Pyxidicoccus xibeiensis]